MHCKVCIAGEREKQNKFTVIKYVLLNETRLHHTSISKCTNTNMQIGYVQSNILVMYKKYLKIQTGNLTGLWMLAV